MSKRDKDNHEPLTLRHCYGCTCDVNHFEWKTCKNVNCPGEFSILEVVYQAPNLPLKPRPRELTVTQRRRAMLNNGMACPFCEKPSLTMSDIIDQSGIRATREMTCENKHTWFEVFGLVNIISERDHDILYNFDEPTSDTIHADGTHQGAAAPQVPADSQEHHG